MAMYNPPHPGAILVNYLQGKSVTEVALHLGVTRVTLSRILNGKSAISAEMAIRISKVFGTEPEIWLRLQSAHDLWIASRKKIRVKPFPVSGQAA